MISGIGWEVRSPSGRPISNVVQTNAAIHPGKQRLSPPRWLREDDLDGNGRYTPRAARPPGVGFATPSDTAGYVVEMLTKNGQIVWPLSGVSILDSKQARQAFGIPKGMLVLEEVKPGTPAAPVRT